MIPAGPELQREVTIDQATGSKLESRVAHFEDVAGDAQKATDYETKMSFRTAVKLYPKAICWSMLLSTAIVMEGFDIVLIGSFFGYPPFTKRYGVPIGDGSGDYVIPARWQAGLQNGAQIGEIIGLMANGIISERLGYRKTMIGALFCMICFIFIPFFAKNIETLLVGEILCGLPWGVFQTLTTAYASEIAPVQLRPLLTTYVNLCWVMGQLLASGVLRGLVNNQTQWAYRIPFAIQWIWPLPILIGCLFAPESPYWLCRHDRVDDARKALKALTSNNDKDFDVEKTVAMIVHTNALEKSISEGTRYRDCLKGINLRRTEIACVVWAIQNLCGSAFMGYSTVFYERAGLDVNHAFDLSMAQYGIGFVGTMSSWFLMRYFGRRTLYLFGLTTLCCLLFTIGCLGLAHGASYSWAIGSMLLIYTFCYDITIGPVCYCLVAEVSSTRLRAKTIVLARNLYNICGIVNSVITPYMLNQKAWNWGAKTGFFWFGISVLCTIWCYFRLPEPKGRTYGELDILFEHRVSARKFASTPVNHAPTRVHDSKETTTIEYKEDVKG